MKFSIINKIHEFNINNVNRHELQTNQYDIGMYEGMQKFNNKFIRLRKVTTKI